MNATVLDLRKNMKHILAVIDRNEQITLTYRGSKKAVIVPCNYGKTRISTADHPVFAMWDDHDKLDDVDSFIRTIRKTRKNAI